MEIKSDYEETNTVLNLDKHVPRHSITCHMTLPSQPIRQRLVDN